jgi:hypothetical protein
LVLKQQEHQQQAHQQESNNRKLKDKGFVKSSKTLIGNKTAGDT